MANAIVQALEQAAERIGKSLSKDAAEAVEKMYRGVNSGVQQVVRNIRDVDDEHANRLIQLAEKIKNNSGETGHGARRRLVNQAQARSEIASILGGNPEFNAEIVIDSAKYPESAQHIADAQSGKIWRGDRSTQGAPKPSVLTIDTSGADANRADSLRGIDTRPPDDRDEYPPAMFTEGGAGASVKYISASDNQGSGSAMGSALRGLPPGTRVKVTVK